MVLLFLSKICQISFEGSIIIIVRMNDDHISLACELAALPFEILEKILSNLSAFEIIRLSQTSQFMRAVALHDHVFARLLVGPEPLVTSNTGNSPSSRQRFPSERVQIPLNLPNLKMIDWVKSPYSR